MEIIHKNIDLENYKSRLPANIPPCRDDLYCIFKNEMDGDWGMLPKTVRVPDNLIDLITDKTDTVLNIPVENGEKNTYYPFAPYTYAFKRHCEYMHSSFPSDVQWFKYYYIQSERVYEHDLIQNTDKEVKFLSYSRMHEWFKFFFFYNETFLGGSGYKEFSSAVERFNWEKTTMHLYDFKYRTEDCQKYDDLYKARGGKEIMRWLFEDVFGCFRVTLDEWFDYYDLVPHFMFFGQIRQWKAWFNNRTEKYKDIEWIQCKDKEDCCDCREWFRKGGMNMWNWLNRQTYPNFNEDLCIDGCINVSFLLTNKISALGYYVPLIEDFSTNQRYNIGNEVLYDENMYRLTSAIHNYHGKENGIDYSLEYKEKMFSDLNPDSFNDDDFVYEWKDKSEWDWNRFEGEMLEENNGKHITGYTTSKLADLRDLIISTDDMGNDLHGFLNSSTASSVDSSDNATVFLQPDEGTIEDMVYHFCNIDDLTTELTNIKDPDKTGVFHNIYWGSIITDMTFYLVNDAGERIPVEEGYEDLYKGTRITNLDAIRQCEAEMDINNGVHADGYESHLNFDGLKDKTVRRKLYCQIEYVIGGLVDKVYGTNDDGNEFSYFKELDENAEYNPYKYKVGVRYTETAMITKNSEFYQTNDGTSIMLYYYSPIFNFTSVSVDGQYSVDEQTAQFETYSYMNADNDYNGVITMRMIRREKDLQLTSPFREYSDINIERGTKTALEKMLKLQEIRSFEALEQYGNGTLSLSDSQ